MVNRYTVGLQSPTDPCCYKDFFETNTYEEAKRKLEEQTIQAIIYDSKLGMIVDKKIIETKKEEVKPVVKKTRKKKETKDVYFD